MAAEITYHRLKYSWLVGVFLAFGIFALVAFYSARMTYNYPDYEERRNQQRLTVREKVDHDENALLHPVDDKGNPTATWVNQDKGLIQIPIDEAMAHEVQALKDIPVAQGAEIPGSAPAAVPAPAPAATNAAPATPAATGQGTNAAPAIPAKPVQKKAQAKARKETH